MKKCFSTIAALLAAGILAGCAPAAPQPQGGGQALQNSTVQQASQAESTEISVILPAGRDDLAGILATMAAADGNTLRLLRLADGPQYTNELEQALDGENPPDLFWIEGEPAAIQLQAGGQLSNLLGQQAGTSMQALALVVPQGGRLVDEQAVYGLPVGFYAQGYLVNIELLAALLGTENYTALREDLQNCSWQQWSALVQLVDAYLQKPAAQAVRLGSGVYAMPSYRPTAAQQLRGVFAVASVNGEGLTDAAMEKAFVSAFGSWQRYAATPEDALPEALWPAFNSMAGLLDLETMYMASKEGPVRRGDDFAARDELSSQQALELFTNGTALFLRADSRTGLQLEQEDPTLEGRLALVPLKMPVPQKEEEEPQPSGEDETPPQASSQTESLPQPAEEAPADDGYDSFAAIEAGNSQLVYTADGYLCIAAGSGKKTAAQALLLRLFTAEEGLTAVQQLHLLPFSSIYPQGGLQNQVAQALSGQGSRMVTPAGSLANAQQSLGAFVRENLMLVSEWGEEEQMDYFMACWQALGYNIEIVPDIDPGEAEE